MTDKKQTVFEQLRKLNIWEHVEKKNGFNYLSWAWATEQMYMFDEDAEIEFLEREVFPDGTVMLYCNTTIKGKRKQAFLPVMDYKNQAIRNPNARQISDNMQRCLVKSIAMHGLGLGLYAGEDLPVEEPKGAEVIGGSMRSGIDRETQEAMRDTAISFLNQCATIDAVDKYAKANHKSWKDTLDEDLYNEIVACGSEAKNNIRIENQNRNEDLR